MRATSANDTRSFVETPAESRRIWLREQADGTGRADRVEAFLNEIRKDRLREMLRERSPILRLFRRLGRTFMGIAAYGTVLAAFYQIVTLT